MKEQIEKLIREYKKALCICKKTWRKYPNFYSASEETLLDSIISDLENLLKSEQ